MYLLSPRLQAGYEILDVNGRRFTSIPHDEAVRILKYCERLCLRVRDVRKVPHAAADRASKASKASTASTVASVWSPAVAMEQQPPECAVSGSSSSGKGTRGVRSRQRSRTCGERLGFKS